jgi:prepilin-type N-terminal cleavage/methylation domain-containing protein
MKRQKGFTLIEAIVATSIFAFTVSSIIGVYIAVLRLDTRTRAQRAIANDARFIMDFLAKEIRNGRLDYASFPDFYTCKADCGSAEWASDIYLINQEGVSERIYYWDTTVGELEPKLNCSPAPNQCDLLLNRSGNITRLNSPNVRVTTLKFIPTPWGDPYEAHPPRYGLREFNIQPYVTVIIELTANINSRDQVKINVESTFSTQYYPPRP